MGRINSIEKITSNLVDNIQQASLKAVQGQIEDAVRFFVGTVVNIDTLNNRAKVRYMRTEDSSYADIECAIKTDEIIELNDIVIVLYIRNLSNSFVFGKMTSSYYSKLGNYTSQEALDNILKNYYVTLKTNQTITGAKTFSNVTTKVNQELSFTDKDNPHVEMTSKDSGNVDRTYYVQSYQGKAGIGPDWGNSTVWDESGNVTFPSTPTVNGKNIAVFEECSYASDDGTNFTHWIRFTNGIQILWGHFDISKFSTGERTVNFNKAFSDIPSVSFNPVTTRAGSSHNREIFPMEVTSSSVKIYWNTNISISGYDLIAFGHWSG